MKPIAAAAFCLSVGLVPAWAAGQEVAPGPPTSGAVTVVTRARVPRPRMSVAIGMGATFDAVGFETGGARAIPAFFATAGLGDGLIGTDVGAFASAASGRFTSGTPVDRLALDAMAVVRPFARDGISLPYRPKFYGMRVLRSVGVEMGVGLERDAQGGKSVLRVGVHTGGRVEVPLTPLGEPSEVRLRIGLRHLFGGYVPHIDTLAIKDSTELYGALAVLF